MVLFPSSPELQPSPLPPDAFQKAKINTEKCVVGVFEEWDESMRVIQHWFPWIKITNREKICFYIQIRRRRKLFEENW